MQSETTPAVVLDVPREARDWLARMFEEDGAIFAITAADEGDDVLAQLAAECDAIVAAMRTDGRICVTPTLARELLWTVILTYVDDVPPDGARQAVCAVLAQLPSTDSAVESMIGNLP
ncbi:MAG: hypothetical protein M3401_06305 [Actinomycetota bacterium]|nr:hypothetical protein [Actinomycetota bacterium]